jgi:hypothetical protein
MQTSKDSVLDEFTLQYAILCYSITSNLVEYDG